MSPLDSDIFEAALALPPAARAELASKLWDSLQSAPNIADKDSNELDVDELAERLTAHFHETKKIALRRAEEIQSRAAASLTAGNEV